MIAMRYAPKKKTKRVGFIAVISFLPAHARHCGDDHHYVDHETGFGLTYPSLTIGSEGHIYGVSPRKADQP